MWLNNCTKLSWYWISFFKNINGGSNWLLPQKKLSSKSLALLWLIELMIEISMLLQKMLTRELLKMSWLFALMTFTAKKWQISYNFLVSILVFCAQDKLECTWDHNTFRRRPIFLLNVLCTLRLHPVSGGSGNNKFPISL